MKKGFTLVEVLIAVSLSSIILLTGTFVFSSYYRIYKSSAEKAELLQIRQSVMQRIVKDYRQDYGKITYGMKNGKVRKTENGYSAYLTDTGEISRLDFKLVKSNLVMISVDSLEGEAALRNE